MSCEINTKNQNEFRPTPRALQRIAGSGSEAASTSCHAPRPDWGLWQLLRMLIKSNKSQGEGERSGSEQDEIILRNKNYK